MDMLRATDHAVYGPTLSAINDAVSISVDYDTWSFYGTDMSEAVRAVLLDDETD
jgi:hypothetical protein